MKLIPISFDLYNSVMYQLELFEPHPTQEIPLYTPEQKYHILRYLINFLQAEQAEISKKIVDKNQNNSTLEP